MVSWATNFFLEKFVKPSAPPSYILKVHSLSPVTCGPLHLFNDLNPVDRNLFNLSDLLDQPICYWFVFGEFNVHHKDWLTYSGGTLIDLMNSVINL